jgi:GxxExxY protein
MHRLYQAADALSGQVIGAAIEVHRILGPGLLESIYERCLLREFELRGIAAVNQQRVAIEYKGLRFEESLRFDVLVESALLVEVKAVEEVLAVHKAITMSYMKLLDVPIGLIINFHEAKLVDGLSRLYLPGANRAD